VIKYTADGQLWVNDPVTGDAGQPTANGDNICVFPNPASDHITIKGLSVHRSWWFMIFNVHGQLCMSGNLDAQTIDISALSGAWYYLMIGQAELNKTNKFIFVKQGR
jgi:hypothetical protein